MLKLLKIRNMIKISFLLNQKIIFADLNKKPNKMKKLIFAASTLVLFACSNNEQPEQVTENIEVIVTKHGEEITEEGALTAAEYIAQLQGKDSLEAKLMAPIADVCQKKGCWMMLDLGNDVQMRVTFKDYGFFMPKDAAGRMAYVQGVGKIDTTSVEELKHYLKDANASQEEIDAVTEPEIEYVFEAIGVIIKEEKLTTSGDAKEEEHNLDHNHDHDSHEGHEH